MTHYEVLGVAENATSTQIRNAYRKLVKQYHPDKNPSPEAAEFIKQINEAYDVLSDPQRRATYDRRYQVYFEPVIVQQETPEEIYRREFIRHLREQEQIKRDRRRAWEVTKDNVYQKIYAVMRMVAIPIALFAFGLFVDSFLPPKIYQEIGWHGGDGYMQTTTFLIGVPKAVSDNYDYDHPVALNISVTPIFKKLKEASLTLYYQHYSWDIRSWFRTFTEFLLLISSIYIAFEKEYTRQKFKLSFYMTGLFVIALLYF